MANQITQSAEQVAVLQRIVQLVAYEVPDRQIALAVGLSEGRISQIKGTAEFQKILQEFINTNLEDDNLVNQGWDSVEKLALSKIVDNLQWNTDPDFALRAAQVANKASRRGSMGNTPINGRVGARAVINLSSVFIHQLKISGSKPYQPKDAQVMKDVNALDVSSVENLLLPQKEMPDTTGVFINVPNSENADE